MPASAPMLLILHYDGSAFAGWQRQKNDRTVQAELETALAKLTGSKLAVRGAGRTDAGVHAVGQAAAATVPGKWQPAELTRAMNAVLPSDVWVASACRMQPGFDPRRDAMERTYCYRLGLDTCARSPFRRRWEWSLTPPFDAAALHDASSLLIGTHGFQALCAAGQEKAHYNCTVHEAVWQRRDDGAGLEFWITADRFLHHMVRFLVGFMVDAARGRRPVKDLEALLDSTDNQAASPPAPPHGLFLVNVRYPARCFA